MSTPFDIFGVIAATGQKLVAALLLPAGLVTAAGATITGGTVTGSPTVPTAATAVYLGLSESPTSVYGATSDISALPDATTRPYTVEVRIVASGTDMTSYSAIAAAFAASSSVAYSRDVPATLSGGMLTGGVWALGDMRLATLVSGVNVTQIGGTNAVTAIEDAVWDAKMSDHPHGVDDTYGGVLGTLQYFDDGILSVGISGGSLLEVAQAMFTLPTGLVFGNALGQSVVKELAAGAGVATAGNGEFPIDHNGGSGTAGGDCTFYIPYSNSSGIGSTANLLKFTSDGTTGMEGLSIRAYVASDYDAGLRDVVATTRTLGGSAAGQWQSPLNLDPGTYYIIADNPGDAYQAYQVKVVVP